MRPPRGGSSLISRCYAPRTTAPAPQPIDPADVRVGDRVRIVNEGTAIPASFMTNLSRWSLASDSTVTYYLLDRPDPDAPIVGTIARAITEVMMGRTQELEAAGRADEARLAEASAVLDAIRAEYVIEPKAGTHA